MADATSESFTRVLWISGSNIVGRPLPLSLMEMLMDMALSKSPKLARRSSSFSSYTVVFTEALVNSTRSVASTVESMGSEIIGLCSSSIGDVATSSFSRALSPVLFPSSSYSKMP